MSRFQEVPEVKIVSIKYDNIVCLFYSLSLINVRNFPEVPDVLYHNILNTAAFLRIQTSSIIPDMRSAKTQNTVIVFNNFFENSHFYDYTNVQRDDYFYS